LCINNNTTQQGNKCNEFFHNSFFLFLKAGENKMKQYFILVLGFNIYFILINLANMYNKVT
jgi:hypothetical protein